MQATGRGLRAIPKGVWALGAVSLLMDASSELIHGLLPVFLVVTLGASPVALGLIEGIAEATGSIVKLFSGALSDRLGRRKLLLVAGYGLAALSKPLFPLASSSAPVLAARFIDRIGKGIRGAPRDALIADLAPAGLRGACFGLRQSLDTAGAVLGPLAAVALMALLAGNIRLVLWFAVIPAVLAVAVLLLAVEEPAHAVAPARRVPLRWRETMALGSACWKVVAVGAVMSLARFSEAFLILRAQQQGLSTTLAPLALALMSVVYAASAYPAGALADRIDRRRLLMGGLMVLVLADLLLAAGGLVPALAGVALWGLHMGLSQGLLAALVADTAPPALRGSAFGVFNLASGLVLLLASLLAGLFWEFLGASATFLAGALFASLAALLLARWSTTGAGP
ncbi:MFS transporter [Geminicoccaceae bacterium 1502E]|nr:MFS transporter [Geminicoccaceae bacterium 1502E]